jgi:putative transposase
MVARPGQQQAADRRGRPRRQRRYRARTWLQLGSQASRGEAAGRPSRPERRRRIREAMRGAADERATVLRSGLEALGHEMALRWLHRELEAEADALCGGPKGKHNPERVGRRHGYELGTVPLGGARVEVARPRVRSCDGKHERPSELWPLVQDESFLCEAVLAQTLAGVAQRRYRVARAGAVQLPEVFAAGTDSKSAVGRRFVEETRAWMREWLSRPLGEARYLVLFVDGLQLGAHHVIAAVGVTEYGVKHVLGLWEGSTENSDVCGALLEDLLRRGLSVDQGLLVVIDGGKGIGAAVREVLGDRAVVHRCHLHKERNLIDKLPQHRQETVRAALHRAWSAPDADRAEAQLHRLIRRLEAGGEIAAAQSLREGLAETLTCLRLGVHPDLRPALQSTNVIESAFSRHEGVAHRVKRWRNGDQALRWVAASLAIAERGFKRLSAEHLAALATALAAHVRSATPSRDSTAVA